MTQQVKAAVALWLLLAVVVFSVTFDWETRAAGWAFVGSQSLRHQQGLPTLSINDGFRPMVRAAAWHSAVWLVLIAGAGTAMTALAARSHK
jgi:hypothetical protein